MGKVTRYPKNRMVKWVGPLAFQDSERRQIHWYLKSLHKFDPNPILHVTDYQLYIYIIYIYVYVNIYNLMLKYITCFDGSYLHKRDPYPYITSEQLQYADRLWIIKKNTLFKMIHHHSAKIKRPYPSYSHQSPYHFANARYNARWRIRLWHLCEPFLSAGWSGLGEGGLAMVSQWLWDLNEIESS